MMRALPAIAGALIATCIAAGANDALNFVNTNWAAPAPAGNPLDIRAANQRRDESRARIHAATTAAAQRHGVPVEFMHRLTMRESGYRFVQGPPTRWGRAQGPHQILCSTAASLGEEDCSRLMRDADRSADLAARYVRMGFDATGTWHGAAAHYHGGPNKRLWGPKTAAYARAVGGNPVQVADRSAPFDTRRTFGTATVQASTFTVASLEYR